jgi:xanthine dehydrogenase iron-sulfur cluster and FAD-binding subunit A
VKIALTVNGERHEADVWAGESLLFTLREQLGLPGSKNACEQGECGSCSVLLDGKLVCACLVLTAQAEGHDVVTVEGLGEEGRLHRVQEAFADAGAVQCGFCTPGLVVALTWALMSGTDPRRAAAGNLCRCTGYTGIRRACDLLATHAGPVPLDALLPEPVLRAARTLPTLDPEPFDGHPHRWLAGATDEIPEHRHATSPHRRPTLLRRVPELCRISGYPAGVELGSAVTVAQVQASEMVASRWPGLPDHLEQFGSPAVRAAATLGGNLVHASPTADLALPLLAMGASVVLSGADGRREVPLERFFLAYRKVDLRHGEVLLAVRIPDPPPGSRLHLEKVAKRRFDDIASASLAVRLDPDPAGILMDLRIAAGGVAPTPLLLTRTADALRGTRPDSATIRLAVAVLAAEITPIDDVRGSAAYKRALLGHLLVAALSDGRPDLAAEVLNLPGPLGPTRPSPDAQPAPMGRAR